MGTAFLSDTLERKLVGFLHRPSATEAIDSSPAAI
jgi:hypothetical protein